MLWTEPGLDECFALLSVRAQQEIHRYYQPNVDLTEDDFEACRQAIYRTDPQLTHQAGKHFHLLESTFIHLSRNCGASGQQIRQAVTCATHKQYKAKHPDSKISLSFIANPEPDAQKLARAFIQLATDGTRQMKANESVDRTS